ncbi:MAG: sugar phosphate isomerase/epimerase family protein [Lachnospiraceae bacterium]|jgi:sugar phosphate isomerase/epimerase
MEAALQTMCIEEEIEKNGIYQALQKTKEIGYRFIEISGHLDLTDKFLTDLKKASQELDVRVCAVSCTYGGPFAEPVRFAGKRALSLTGNYDEAVQTLKSLGCDTLRFAGLPTGEIETEEDLYRYCRVTQGYAERLKADGIRLCAHNHVGEFAKINGHTLFERTLEWAPDLNYEMDIFGVQMSGMSPIDFLAMAKGRVPLIHFSDIAVKRSKDVLFSDKMLERVPMGSGNFNLRAIFDAASAAGVEYMVMEAVRSEGSSGFAAMKSAKETFDRYI